MELTVTTSTVAGDRVFTAAAGDRISKDNVGVTDDETVGDGVTGDGVGEGVTGDSVGEEDVGVTEGERVALATVPLTIVAVGNGDTGDGVGSTVKSSSTASPNRLISMVGMLDDVVDDSPVEVLGADVGWVKQIIDLTQLDTPSWYMFLYPQLMS